MYVKGNPKTKKALREAVAAYNAGTGPEVEVFQPGLGVVTEKCWATVEGPHYPKPHTWYAQVQITGGRVIKVI